MVLAAGNKVWIPATGPEAEEDPYELAEVLDTNPLKCFTGFVCRCSRSMARRPARARRAIL